MYNMQVPTINFVGNLGRDPEFNFVPSGKAICKFSVAVNQGEGKPTMWLRVVCWEKLAEQCGDKLKKGFKVEVSGRFAMDEWDDKETGQKRQGYTVTARTVKLIDDEPSGSFVDESSVTREARESNF